MPAKEKKADGYTKPNKPRNKRNSTGGSSIDASNGKMQSDTGSNDSHQTINIPSEINVVIPAPDNSEHRRSNSIAIVAVCINTFMLLFTSVIAYVAIIQSKSAITASTIAKQTLDSAVSYRKQDLISAKINDSIRYTKDTTAFGLQKRTFENQIASVKENRKEFEIANAPFLEIKIVDAGYFVAGKPFSIIMSIKNIGAYPAQTISITAGLQISKEIPKFFVQNNKNYLKGYSYLTKDAEDTLPIGDLLPSITDDMLNELRKPNNACFIEFFIVYKNLVNNKKRYYKEIISIDYKRNRGVAYLLNKNADFK